MFNQLIQWLNIYAGAGERLEDLTSREGDWFLDELTSISGNVNYTLNMLTANSAVSIMFFWLKCLLNESNWVPEEGTSKRYGFF